MTMSYKSEQDAIKQRLEADIQKYLATGGKIDVRAQGESKQVDMTNGWHDGFCIDDNVGFGKKRPRHV
jgi:hypothetical protein